MSLAAEAIITGQDSQTLASLGEFGLITALSAWLPPGRRTLVGIGDDAAVLAVPDGRVVATTDFLLEGRHFRRDWSGAADVGHKAAARSLADLAAMGAEPSALLVALAAPADLPVSWARELAEGLAAECARAGASVIGGDTARAGSVLLAVTGLGDLAGRTPVLRSGAAPGDLVAVAGPLGPAAAGLALLTAGLTRPWLRLVAAHLRPAPPYDAGPEAADLGATAMIDISDGLLADLGHVAAASGVRIDLASDALRPGDALLDRGPRRTRCRPSRFFGPNGPRFTPAPLTAASTRPAADADGALRWVLTGGEDHSLAATFPPGTRLPPRWRVIGSGAPGSWRRRRRPAVGAKPPAGITSPRALAGDLACLDAGGAHVEPLGRAADHGADGAGCSGYSGGGYGGARTRRCCRSPAPCRIRRRRKPRFAPLNRVTGLYGDAAAPGGSGSRRSLPDAPARARTGARLSADASMLPGVTTLSESLIRVLGPKTGKPLEAIFGLRTVGDLLRHYPRRYYTRGELTDLSSLREGNHVTVLARVVTVAEIPLPSLPGKGRRSRLEVVVTDDRAKLILTFFSGWAGTAGCSGPDVVGMFAGTVSSFRGRRQLVHPECEMLPGAPPNADLTPELAAEFAAEMIPVYPASAKFSSWAIAKSVKTVLDTLDAGEDPLPAELRERYGLDGRAEAIRAIHRPLDQADLSRARERLKWDEAFMLQAALAQRRLAAAAHAGHAAAARARRHRRRVRRPAAVHAHRGAGRGGRDHRRRAELRLPDAPAAAGRGRLGQDGDRDPGDAPGGGRGRPGGAARADRGARAAALPVDHRHARPAGPGAASSARPSTRPASPCSPGRWGRPPGARRCPTCSPATPGS